MILFVLIAVTATSRARAARPYVVSGGSPAMPAMRRGKWTVLIDHLANRTKHAREMTVLNSFDGAGGTQYGATVRVPARSNLQVNVLAFCPRLPGIKKSLGVKLLLIDPKSNPERQLDRTVGLGAVVHGGEQTACIEGSGRGISSRIVALRLALGLSRTMVYINPRSAPTSSPGWDAMRYLVIAGAANKLNPAQVTAIRDWVCAGGNLWIMAQRLPRGSVAKLLSDTWNAQRLGATRVARYAIDGAAGLHETFSHLKSARLARCLTSGLTTRMTLGRWPVAMTARVGLGRVVITTLSLRGFFSGPAGRVAGPAAVRLAHLFYADQTAFSPVRQASIWPGYAASAIGYRVISRTPVAAVLLIFCGGLVIAGIVLMRRRRLEWFAPGGIVLALGAGAVLLLMGARHRASIAPTASFAVKASVVPSQQRMVAVGDIAAYGQVRALPLSGTGQANALPRSTGQSLRRLIGQPGYQWQWQHVAMASGATTSAKIKDVVYARKLPQATGRFGPKGLVCALNAGRFTDANDAIVRGPAGLFSVPGNAGAAVVFGAADALPPGEFVRAAVLSGRQQKHQRAYRRLPGSASRRSTAWMFWTRRLQLDMRVGGGLRNRSAALVVCPVIIRRDAPGARVYIPSEFLPYGPARLKGHLGGMTALDPVTHEWLANLNHGMTIWLAFHVPKTVLPLRVTRLTARLRIDAPGRRVSLLGYDRGVVKTLTRVASPLGRVIARIPGGALAQPDANGDIILGIRVQHLRGALKNWTIHGVDMALRGRVRRASRGKPAK